MLTVAKMGKGSALYYANLAQEQQEFDATRPGEPPGTWWGAGAKALGLQGNINRADFILLFNGFSPEEESLVKNADDENRVPGWDLVFAPPASIGKCLWGIAPPEIRAIVEECHVLAQQTALSYLEERAWVRRGQGGREIEKAGLVVAIYPHGTNRNGEPFLHSHCLVLNLAVSQEQEHCGALHSKPLYQAKMAAGAIYRSELAHLLQQRLGLNLERVQSWFELRGFSREGGKYRDLMNLWSSRRREIEEHNPQNAKEAQAIAYKTRAEKPELPPRSQLFARWQETGREYGFGPEPVQKLVKISLERKREGRTFERKPTTLAQKWQEWRTIREAASRVVRSESHFTRRDLVWRMAEASQTRGIDAEGVFALTEKYLASRQVMSLGTIDGEERFTTKRLWKLERQILNQVRDLDGDRGRFRVPSHRITVAAETYHLTRTQTEAVRTLSARGRIKSLAGISGTGKTHTLGAVREAFERSGYRVLGITPSKRGAERLQEQGAFGKQSRLSGALFGRKQQPITFHRLFWELDRAKESQRQYGRRSIFKSPLSRTTVVIADSAQDLSAVQMKRLVAEVQRAGAKLILSGDLKRSAAYEHGGAFRAIARTLNAPELSEIKRQESQLGRELVRHVDRGRAILALRKLDERGQFSTSPTREKAIETLVRVWAKQGCKHPRDHLILSEDPEDRQILNRLAQAQRKQHGDLAGAGVRVGKERIYRGDRVRLGETSSTYGIVKGTFGEVRHIDPVTKVAAIRLDSGKHKLANLRHYKGMELGYCILETQAREVETRYAYVLSRGLYGRQGAALQLSRAKVETHLHTYQLEREEEAIVELARKMSREKHRDFARMVERERSGRE